MFPRRSSAENREETCSLGRPAAACVQSYRYVPGVRCCAWFRVRVGVMVRVRARVRVRVRVRARVRVKDRVRVRVRVSLPQPVLHLRLMALPRGLEPTAVLRLTRAGQRRQRPLPLPAEDRLGHLLEAVPVAVLCRRGGGWCQPEARGGLSVACGRRLHASARGEVGAHRTSLVAASARAARCHTACGSRGRRALSRSRPRQQ